MKRLLVIIGVLFSSAPATAQWRDATRVSNQLTGSMFSDDNPSAIINRIADRALIGAATVQDGKRFPSTSTWVAQQASGFMTYFDSRSTAEVISPTGATAIAGASRTSDMNPSDTGTIGFLAFALNDYQNATQNQRRSAWGHYTHVVRAPDASTLTGTGGNGSVSGNTFTFNPIPGTAPVIGSGLVGSGIALNTWITAYNGGTGVATFSGVPQAIANGTTVTYSTGVTIPGGIQGMEMDVANQGSVVNVDPYGGGTSQTGMTLNLLLGSGGETGFAGLTVNPASTAMLIANNHGQFMKGIVVGANAIYGNDGVSTPYAPAPALVMAKGHEIQWRFSGGDTTPAYSAVIRSDNNALGTLVKQIFRTNGASFTDQFENNIGRFQPPSTAQGQTTNYTAFLAAVAASGTPSPVIASTGTDATVGMDFQTQGQGVYNLYSRAKVRLLARITDLGSANAGGNSILINANDAGAAPSIASGGVDTNVDIGLTAKGSGAIVFNAPARLKSYTVATLPACGAALADAVAVVTDATAPTYNGALTGGGAVRVPVYCNSVAWTSH